MLTLREPWLVGELVLPFAPPLPPTALSVEGTSSNVETVTATPAATRLTPLQIMAEVTRVNRPRLDNELPEDLRKLVELAVANEPSERPTTAHIAVQLRKCREQGGAGGM